jgi:nucleotide-binding universal stress UspA family protein
MPTTLIDIGAPVEEGATPDDEGRVHAVQAAAEAAKATSTRDERTAPSIDVVRPKPEAPTEEVVASEAAKGYDLLAIGLERVEAEGAFDPSVNRIAAQFEGPLALAVARGVHLEDPTESRLNVLVPITGTEVSLQGMEVGIALARATGASVTALYVSSGDAARRARRSRTPGQSRERAEAILREAVEVADRYDVEMRTALKRSAAPIDAILREAGSNRHTLIVMGVNRRPGDTLFFGDLASAVLERSSRSILFVSSPRAFGTPPDASAGKGRTVAGAVPAAQSRTERSRQSA